MERMQCDNCGYVYDKDEGDELSYTVRADYSDFVELSLNGETLTWTPKAYASAIVTITAIDILQNTASTSFRLSAMSQENNAVTYPAVAKNDAYVMLSIPKDDARDIRLTLYNALGGVALRKTFTSVHVFNPIHLDLTKVAAGRYTALIEGWGAPQKRMIVKY